MTTEANGGNPLQNVEIFIAKEFHQIVQWIEGKEAEIKPIITLAENVLNAIKSFESSAVGQTLELVIETVIPQSTKLIDAFKLQLPVWLIDLGWVKDEAGKSLTDQWNEALAYLETIKGTDVYAAQLNTLKALFTKFFSVNQLDATNPSVGSTMNIQQALLIAQPSHNVTNIIGS